MGWVRRSQGEVPRCSRRRRLHYLAGENLVFRTPGPRDLGPAFAAASDDEAQDRLGWGIVVVPAERRAALLAADPGPLNRWSPTAAYLSLVTTFPDDLDLGLVAIARDANEYAGLVAIERVADGTEWSIGGWLAPAYRGRGLGGELFVAACNLAHDHLGITTVSAGTQVGNVAAHRALLSAGFVLVDGPPTKLLEDGRTVPSLWFEHTANSAASC